jgi:hypothetical protein
MGFSSSSIIMLTDSIYLIQLVSLAINILTINVHKM